MIQSFKYIREAPELRSPGLFVFHITWNSYILLPTGIIAYAVLDCNIPGDGFYFLSILYHLRVAFRVA